MKQVFLLLFLFTICHLGVAQQNFQPGYILQQGDTVRGLVDQRGDKRNATKVTFKATPDSPEQTFEPKDLSGYGFTNGPRYETWTINTSTTEQAYFLMVLVKGKASLYSYRDGEGQDHFYLKQGESLQELVYKRETQLKEGRRVTVPYHYYRGVLFQAFADCPAQTAKINDLPFNTTALTAITVQYNQCQKPPQLEYVQASRKTEFVWGPTVGASLNQLEIDGGAVLVKKGQQFRSAVGFTAGVFLNTTFPWLNQKISFQTELLYSQNHYTKTINEDRPPAKEHHHIDLNLHYLRLPVLLRYTFPKGNLRPFVNVGMVNSYAVNVKQEITTNRVSVSATDSYVTKKPYLEGFRKYEQSYAFGAGMLLPRLLNRKASLEARYERGNGFSNFSQLTAKTDKLTVLVSIGI